MRTKEEIIDDLLLVNGNAPILRKMMNKEEIKIANQLVKEGKLVKGKSQDKQKTVCYYNDKL